MNKMEMKILVDSSMVILICRPPFWLLDPWFVAQFTNLFKNRSTV